MTRRRYASRRGVTMTELAVVLAIVALLATAVATGASALRRNQQEVVAPVVLATAHSEVVSMAASPQYAYRLPAADQLAPLLRAATGTVGESSSPDRVSVAVTSRPTYRDGVVLAVRGHRSCIVVWEVFDGRSVWARDADVSPGNCTAVNARNRLHGTGSPTSSVVEFANGPGASVFEAVGTGPDNPWESLDLDG